MRPRAHQHARLRGRSHARRCEGSSCLFHRACLSSPTSPAATAAREAKAKAAARAKSFRDRKETEKRFEAEARRAEAEAYAATVVQRTAAGKPKGFAEVARLYSQVRWGLR